MSKFLFFLHFRQQRCNETHNDISLLNNSEQSSNNSSDNHNVTTSDINQSTNEYSNLHTKTITTTDLVCWSFQVARGMSYLSLRGVLHGDLAARNILLCSDNVVKICDFGLSRSLHPTEDYMKSNVRMHLRFAFVTRSIDNMCPHNNDPHREWCPLNGWPSSR